MANSIGDLALKIVVDSSGVARGMNNALRSAGRGRQVGGYQPFGAHYGQTRYGGLPRLPSFGGIGSFGMGLGGGLGAGMLGKAGALGAVAGVGVAGVAGVFGGAVLGINALTAASEALSNVFLELAQRGGQLEQLEVAFGVLTGSQRIGSDLLGKVQQYAVESPFRIETLAEQTKLLLSYGVAAGEVVTVLKQIGDIASGTGTDLERIALAYGQVMAKGRLQGPELRQLTEAGISLNDIARASGMSAAQMLSSMEAGQVSAMVLETAFVKLTSAGGRFYKMTERMNNTLLGQWNQLKETFELMASKMGLDMIKRFNLVPLMQGLTGKAGQLVSPENLDRLADWFSKTKPSFDSIVASLGGIVGAFAQVGEKAAQFAPLWKDVKGTLDRIGTHTIPALLAGLQELTRQLVSWANTFVGVFSDVRDLTMALAPPSSSTESFSGFISTLLNPGNRLAGGVFGEFFGAAGDLQGGATGQSIDQSLETLRRRLQEVDYAISRGDLADSYTKFRQSILNAANKFDGVAKETETWEQRLFRGLERNQLAQQKALDRANPAMAQFASELSGKVKKVPRTIEDVFSMRDFLKSSVALGGMTSAFGKRMLEAAMADVTGAGEVEDVAGLMKLVRDTRSGVAAGGMTQMARGKMLEGAFNKLTGGLDQKVDNLPALLTQGSQAAASAMSRVMNRQLDKRNPAERAADKLKEIAEDTKEANRQRERLIEALDKMAPASREGWQGVHFKPNNPWAQRFDFGPQMKPPWG